MNLQQIQCHISNVNELPFPIKKEQQHNFPPWLSCLPNVGPPQPIDLTTTPSSLIQDFQQNQDFNPNPNPSLGPTTLYHHPPPPPHISATALLQKAAQMGAKSSSQCPSPSGVFSRAHQGHVSPAHQSGFGLNLSSRDEFINGWNKAAASAAAAANATVTVGSTTSNITTTTPAPSLLQDMLMSSNYEQDSTFEDMSFGAFLNNASPKKGQESLDFHATLGHFSRRNSNGGNEGNDDGMTRDFLGLRPLSQSDIMSIAGLSSCMTGNSCNENQNQRSWQG